MGRPWQSHPSIREDVQVLESMQSGIPRIFRQAAWDVLDLMTCGLDTQFDPTDKPAVLGNALQAVHQQSEVASFFPRLLHRVNGCTWCNPDSDK